MSKTSDDSLLALGRVARQIRFNACIIKNERGNVLETIISYGLPTLLSCFIKKNHTFTFLDDINFAATSLDLPLPRICRQLF